MLRAFPLGTLVFACAFVLPTVAFADGSSMEGAIRPTRITGKFTFTAASPAMAGSDLIDSLCVAVSNDGGQQFNFTVCKTHENIGPGGTDQTTVTIGKDDVIYTAVEDFDAARTRLFRVVFGSISPSGVSVDFGVNRLGGAVDVRELVFVYSHRPNPDRVVVGATRCLSTLAGLLDCVEVPEWGTEARAGQHFQPNLHFVDKSAEQDGTGGDWRYAFYEVDRPGVAGGHAQLTMATLGGALPSTNPPSLQYRVLVMPDPSVCTAKYTWQSSEYWGDYMGFTAVPPLGGEPWRHTVAFSSDEGRGCDPNAHPLQGRHLHVESWFWSD